MVELPYKQSGKAWERGRFPWDQIFRIKIPGIPCDERNSFPIRPRLSLSKFPTKIRNKRKENKQQSLFLPYLLALELHDESEVQTNDVFGEDDNNRVRDYFEWTIPHYFPYKFKSLSNDEARCDCLLWPVHCNNVEVKYFR